MSGELQCASLSGLTLYAVIRSPTATVWNTSTSAFEAFTAGNYANYAVAMTEQGTSGYYVGSMPVGITTRGAYSIDVRQQAGGSPAQSDTPILSGPLSWSGGAEQTAAQVALNGSGDVVASSVVGAVTVGGYSAGEDPGTLVLATPANKLTTSAAGDVTVGAYASGEDPATALAAAGVTAARMEQLDAFSGTWSISGDVITATTHDGLHVFTYTFNSATLPSTRTIAQTS